MGILEKGYIIHFKGVRGINGEYIGICFFPFWVF
jgi:hypothetical protein